MEKDKPETPKPNQPESLEGGGETKAPAAPDKDGASQAPAGSSPSNVSPAKKLLGFSRLYLIMFGMVVIIAALAVVISMNMAKQKSSTKTTKATSLTGSQLAQIQGNTTLVGDPKQTLDIQGNAIFEGQGLFRGDLSAAQALKVGGAISGASINIGGTANFSQLQISKTLSVSGDLTVSGGLNVAKNLSVAGTGSFTGALSASSLTVSTITINSDITVSHHILTNGSIPGVSAGTAVGTGGTVSINGSDTAGTINVNVGSSPPAGNLANVSFAGKFARIPHVVVTPIGSSAAGLQFYVTRTASGFTLATASPPAAGSSFSFDYIVIE